MEEKADHTSTTSACVGDATGDQMFTDVSDGHVFRDAINCIAYYGITNGTGDGSTYSPNQAVTRAEMAVLLASAAGVAGVDLGDAMDAGFDDIGDTWGAAQDAINQLADKGIIAKGDNFRPGDDMTRAEMALALVGLLDATGAIDILDGGGIDLDGDGDADTDDADDHFADARALSPVAVDRASAALFELGVTSGSGRAAVVNDKKTPLDTNFDPNGTVDRGQMAAFITRALAHTSARPEGVTAQDDGKGVVTVSVRDENFAPVANAWVEVFYVNTSDEGDARNANGTCSGLVQRSGSGSGATATRNGTHACEIDGSDLLTNGDGDAETLAITVPKGGVVTWAWTGDVGDEVDDDTTLYRLAIAKAAAPAVSGTTAAISNNLAGDVAKMGSRVTVTLQLQKDGENVTGGNHDENEPAEWVVYIETHVFIRAGAAPLGATRGPAVQTSTVPLKSDADGKATFYLVSLPDQDPDERGNAWQVSYDIRAACSPDDSTDPPTAWDLDSCKAPENGSGTFADGELPNAQVNDDDTADGATSNTGNVVFSDEKAVTTDISIDTSSYVQVASRAGRTALNRAKVTLSDQFGDPVRNKKVTLTSSNGRTDVTTDTDGASSLAATTGGTPKPFTTGSDGSYTFGYTWLGDSGGTETLVATYDPTPAATGAPDDSGDEIETDAAGGTDPVQVRWAEAPDEGLDATSATGTVVDGDVDANEIVVEISGQTEPVIIHYDDDDRLNTSDAAAAASSPASMAEFEKKLASYLRPGVAAAARNVTWSNYMNRPRHTSVITLHDS